MMPRLLNAFFLMLCRSTEADLIRQVEYLKAENRVLRSKLPQRVTVTASERTHLVKMGIRVGSAIKDLITIVHPRTFARWVSIERGEKPKPQRRGRPRTPEETRQIVLRLARENEWGFTRLWGELKKLGIQIGKTTLRNILKEHGIDPGPKRLTDGTWDRFIKRHAATLWQCDFVTHRVWTLKGRVDCCLLFFIHVGSRRVWVSPATARPTPLWVAQQARNFSMWVAERGQAVKQVLRDRDGKYHGAFDDILSDHGADVMMLPIRSPNLNAYAERWVQSLRRECLDHFVAIGEQHLTHLVNEYTEHYNTERPHQGVGNVPLAGDWREPHAEGQIGCRSRLGGVLNHYHRPAA